MKIDKKDLKVRYFSGTGPGGQNRNKVMACCEIIHIPTGITEKAQDSRSKSQNYEAALARIEAALEKLAKDRKHEALNEQRKKVFDDTDGSKVIRTYNFKRNEVKDHRTGKTANLKRVLDGDLDLLS